MLFTTIFIILLILLILYVGIANLLWAIGSILLKISVIILILRIFYLGTRTFCYQYGIGWIFDFFFDSLYEHVIQIADNKTALNVESAKSDDNVTIISNDVEKANLTIKELEEQVQVAINNNASLKNLLDKKTEALKVAEGQLKDLRGLRKTSTYQVEEIRYKYQQELRNKDQEFKQRSLERHHEHQEKLASIQAREAIVEKRTDELKKQLTITSIYEIPDDIKSQLNQDHITKVNEHVAKERQRCEEMAEIIIQQLKDEHKKEIQLLESQLRLQQQLNKGSDTDELVTAIKKVSIEDSHASQETIKKLEQDNTVMKMALASKKEQLLLAKNDKKAASATIAELQATCVHKDAQLYQASLEQTAASAEIAELKTSLAQMQAEASLQWKAASNKIAECEAHLEQKNAEVSQSKLHIETVGAQLADLEAKMLLISNDNAAKVPEETFKTKIAELEAQLVQKETEAEQQAIINQEAINTNFLELQQKANLAEEAFKVQIAELQAQLLDAELLGSSSNTFEPCKQCEDLKIQLQKAKVPDMKWKAAHDRVAKKLFDEQVTLATIYKSLVAASIPAQEAEDHAYGVRLLIDRVENCQERVQSVERQYKDLVADHDELNKQLSELKYDL